MEEMRGEFDGVCDDGSGEDDGGGGSVEGVRKKRKNENLERKVESFSSFIMLEKT